jgi:hypothetical protein
MSILASFDKTLSFFESLQDEHVINDYALIGGFALSAWIEPRSTKDIDLVVTVSPALTLNDLKTLVENRLHKRTYLPKMTSMTDIREMFSFVEGDLEIDVISSARFDLAQEAVQNAVTVTVFNKKIKIATPEYLIALKLLPFEAQDIIDIKKLLQIANVAKVEEIAGKFMLLPKLEKIISGAV